MSSYPRPVPLTESPMPVSPVSPFSFGQRPVDGQWVMSYPCANCGYIVTGEPCEVDAVAGGRVLCAASYCPMCKTRHVGRGVRDDAGQ